MQKLSERISYLPAGTEPLSSDVVLIHGDNYEWIFDVGNNSGAVKLIQGIDREKNIILSHFHEDHTGNLKRISYNQVYCGNYTKKKFGIGTEVKSAIIYEDGVKLTIFPLPGLHSKGEVGLEVDEEFAFLGDAVYGVPKDGKQAYNVNLLKEMISILSALKVKYFLLSHDVTFVRSREQILTELKEIYEMRKPGESYIFLDSTD